MGAKSLRSHSGPSGSAAKAQKVYRRAWIALSVTSSHSLTRRRNRNGFTAQPERANLWKLCPFTPFKGCGVPECSIEKEKDLPTLRLHVGTEGVNNQAPSAISVRYDLLTGCI